MQIERFPMLSACWILLCFLTIRRVLPCVAQVVEATSTDELLLQDGDWGDVCQASDQNDDHYHDHLLDHHDHHPKIQLVNDKPSLLSSSSNTAVQSHQTPPRNLVECSLWLAPSTIPGAGLGVFAGKDFRQGQLMDDILGSELVVPIVDKFYHLHRLRQQQHLQVEDPFEGFLDYVWSRRGIESLVEQVYETASLFSPGLGAALNFFLDETNVKIGLVKRDGSNHLLHRSKDPGAGAVSPYTRQFTTLIRNVASGQELFVDYGSDYIQHRPHLSQDDEDPRAETQVLTTRTQQWLYRHAYCTDHLYSAPSTLSQAGRGAFARRDLPAGTVVALLPLIPIMDRSGLDMYQESGNKNNDNNGEERSEGQGSPTPSSTQQLLVNYCFGHNESSLLLCPYGAAASFVNHNHTLANVQISWAVEEPFANTKTILDQPLTKLNDNTANRLAFELVSKRPIQKDEEIFLDYGNHWEVAWWAHVHKWEPVPGAELYQLADEFVQHDGFWNLIRDNPDYYNSLYRVECYYLFRGPRWQWVGRRNKGQLETIIRSEWGCSDCWFDCAVMKEEEEEILADKSTAYGIPVQRRFTIVDIKTQNRYHHVPRLAFRLREKPYTADMFLKNAFRHFLGIPDAIFPDAWKNRI